MQTSNSSFWQVKEATVFKEEIILYLGTQTCSAEKKEMISKIYFFFQFVPANQLISWSEERFYFLCVI